MLLAAATDVGEGEREGGSARCFDGCGGRLIYACAHNLKSEPTRTEAQSCPHHSPVRAPSAYPARASQHRSTVLAPPDSQHCSPSAVCAPSTSPASPHCSTVACLAVPARPPCSLSALAANPVAHAGCGGRREGLGGPLLRRMWGEEREMGSARCCDGCGGRREGGAARCCNGYGGRRGGSGWPAAETDVGLG